jgi:hypothetical protein
LPSFFRLSGIGRHAAVGQGGQASDGRLFAQAPIRSRHPTARVQNGTTHRVDVPERLCIANDLVLVELSAGMTMPEAVWWAARFRLDTAATLAPAR